MDSLISSAVYLPFIALAVIGAYLMLSFYNFIKAIVGLSMFQSAIILFFILMAVKTGASIPILPKLATEGLNETAYNNMASMQNALPHALMLTAIVVGVATWGLAMAILRRLHQETGTVEDNNKVEKL